MLKRLILHITFRGGATHLINNRNFHSEKYGDMFKDPGNKEATLNTFPV